MFSQVEDSSKVLRTAPTVGLKQYYMIRVSGAEYIVEARYFCGRTRKSDEVNMAGTSMRVQSNDICDAW